MQTLNVVILLLFTGLVIAGGVRTLIRYLEYKYVGRGVPSLLKRDVISRNGLAFSFAMILLARAADFGYQVREQIWWVLLTAIPAIFGAAVYAYYEFFVIDKRADSGDLFEYDDLA